MILRRKITLDKSLLASLRIMAIFISIDGELHDKQVKWFTWLIKSRVVNPEHQKLLLEDLKNPPKIQDLFSDVMDSDRERLLGWARIAVNIDGKLDEEEKALYSHLKELIERDNLLKGDSHRVIAQAIIESHERNQFFREITEAANYFKQPIRFPRFFLPLSYEILGLSTGNKYIIGLIIFFTVTVAILRIIAPILLRK